jgi:hypothetical protein
MAQHLFAQHERRARKSYISSRQNLPVAISRRNNAWVSRPYW